MKKLVSLFLALVMVLSMASFASAEEPFVITVLLPDFNVDVDFDTNIETNPVLQAIEKASGVRLDITFAANSEYSNTLATTLTSKPEDLPMIISMDDARGNNMINNARAGAFWDITKYVTDAENYPNLTGAPAVYSNIAIDGSIYGIYKTRAFPRAGIYYRKDIAEACGITKVPETIAELTELAMALAKYSENTYALNMCSYTAGTINIITVAHGAPNNWGIDENGDIYPAHKSPAYLQGLNWLRDLYNAGGIDPNFATADPGKWNDAERNGTAFMRFDCLDNAYRQQEWFETNAGTTEQIWEMIGTLAKEDGSISVWPQNNGFAGELVVTKAVKEEDLPKVMKFLDWANTADGQMLINWGVQDLTYWLDADGFRTNKPASGEDMSTQIFKYQGSLNQLNMGLAGDLCIPMRSNYLTDLRDRYNNLNIVLAPYAVADPCFPFVSDTNTAFGSQLSTIISDAAVQYIAGIIDEDSLRAAWAQWEEEGGAMMTMEYNDAYHASLGE